MEMIGYAPQIVGGAAAAQLAPYVIGAGQAGALAYGAYRGLRAKRKFTKMAKKISKKVNSKRIKSAPARKKPPPAPVNTKVKVSHKKTTAIRPNAVKGVSKKLRVKIEKVINHKGAYGEYIYFGNRQLRQSVTDKYGIFGTDEQNIRWVLDDIDSVYDAASVLFNQKPIAPNYVLGTSNFDKAMPVTVISSSLSMYFRSTSNHCCNIEVFECTYKSNANTDALEMANDSMNDYVIENKEIYSAVAAAALADFGIESRHLTTLHNSCNVKVHKIKLEPGEFATLVIKGKSNKVYDASKNQDASDTTWDFQRGAKNIFFRVFNDITVSGTLADRVHQFQSSVTGGVAMRYKRTYRIAQPTAIGITTAESKNVVRIQGGYIQRTTETDQQVVESANNFSGAAGAVV